MSAEDRLEPVFGPDGQPDAATLAGLELDAFDTETTARIRARLRDSPQTRETLAAVDAVRAQLRSQPTPTMPDAVADRISAALRAESQARSAGRPVLAAGPPAADNVSSLNAARERRSNRTRWMGLAAAGVAVVAAGGIIYGVTTHSTTGGNPNSGSNQAFGTSPSSSSHAQPNGATKPDVGTNTVGKLPDYSQSSLAGQLPAIVRTSKYGVSVPDNYGNGPDVKTCSTTLGQHKAPLAVQHATFNKQDAYVFVFATGSDHQAKVFVVAPTCTGTPIYQASGAY
jgi:negative regulator of sigma E activity